MRVSPLSVVFVVLIEVVMATVVAALPRVGLVQPVPLLG
jgi:hypothetical protein